MESKDISTEFWRTYDTGERIYTIDQPHRLYVGATITHCVPVNAHTIIRWKGDPEVSF